MGIRLDWEVESEAGWADVGEDAAALAARRRRARRLRTIGLVILLIAAIAGGGMGLRLHQISRQLRADLTTIVEIEAQALREGDRSTFLAVQGEFDEWQREQSRTFEDYQLLGDRIQTNGKIVSLEVTADQGLVVVEEILDGRAYHITWFYQRTEEGWRHMPPNPTHWGAQTTLESVNFRITYHAQDEALARELAVTLDEWWEHACRATDCVEAPDAPRVRIEPDPLVDFGWASYADETLIIPSPVLNRVPADGSHDPALFPTIARYLAEHWAQGEIEAYVQSPYAEFSDVAWLRQELALYINHRFDETAPQSGFFNPLTEQFGVDRVRDVLEGTQRIHVGVPITVVLDSVTGVSAADLGIDWGSYLAQRLRAETALIRAGNITEAQLLYRYNVPSGPVDGSEMILNTPTEGWAAPESIELLSVRQFGELTWIEVQYTSTKQDGEQYITYEPYRLVDGQWFHTWATVNDWGEIREERTPHIVLTYSALDEAYAEGLSPHLEQVYTQAAQDFGIGFDTLPVVQVDIVPNRYREGSEVLSAYAVKRDAGQSAAGYIRLTAAHKLVLDMLQTRVSSPALNHPIVSAFLTWEMEHLGFDPHDALALTLQQYGTASPRWPANQVGVMAFNPPYDDDQYQQARALLDVLVARYGTQAIPVLLDHLSASANVDDWLMRSMGITFVDVSAEWQAKLVTSE